MSDIAIKVENLSKQYKIGVQREDTLRDAIVNRFSSLLSRNNSSPTVHRPSSASHRPSSVGAADNTIWALRDVSFEVQRGEVVGIIGRNGAGKSTLLKILSRITEPTSGRAVINGRVGSLLEVGTGFHPELTGRENIYLNGAILGMTRTEINKKFDEIVAFSEIEKFLDTPVKRYSSGMYVRLAFAVAAHLETEILLVDEVLAVGDTAFQKKCLGKMEDLAGVGRTVFFVSHNLAIVQALCNRALYLDSGRVRIDEAPEVSIQKYLQSNAKKGRVVFDSSTARKSTGKAYFKSTALYNLEGELTDNIKLGDGLIVELEFVTNVPLLNPGFGIFFRNSLGIQVVSLTTRITHGDMPEANHGGYVRLRIDDINLLPGRYYISIGMALFGEPLEHIENALEFDVTPHGFYPTGKLPRPGSAMIYLPCSWSHEYF